MTTAADKLAAIEQALDAGKTIYVRTMTRATKVDKRTVKRFKAINRPLFKVSGESLYITAGNRYDCIDGCRIEVHG